MILRVLSVLLAALSCAISGEAVAQTSVPFHREFKDWTLTCDNGKRCAAIAVTENSAGLHVVIERDAGPQGAIHTVIGGLDQSGSQQLRIDDRALRLSNNGWRWEDDEEHGDGLRTTKLSAIQALVDAARNGSTLNAPDNEGESVQVSLQGLSAALLLMDEVQGRLGTRGALLRRGSKLDTTVPVAPSLPKLRMGPAAKPLTQDDQKRMAAAVRRTQAKLLEQEGCLDEPNSDKAIALTDNEALVLIGCGSGAYQSSSVVFQASRKQPQNSRHLKLPLQPDGHADAVTGGHYQPETRTLSHFAKGRGLGDCGEAASWVFDGREFRLASYTSMPRCGGLRDWPSLWRTQGFDWTLKP